MTTEKLIDLLYSNPQFKTLVTCATPGDLTFALEQRVCPELFGKGFARFVPSIDWQQFVDEANNNEGNPEAEAEFQ